MRGYCGQYDEMVSVYRQQDLNKLMEMMGTSSMLYPALKLQDVILANAVVLVLGIITSFLPAWRASRYDPIEALNKN